MNASPTRAPGCRVDLVLTDEARAVEAEVRANGGTLTGIEWQHSEQYSLLGCCWSRRAGEAAVRRARAEGRWLTAHVHDNGEVFERRS